MTNEDFVEVFKGQITEVDLIKFILEEAGLDVWIDNESAGTMMAGMGVEQARILVKPADAERARGEIKRSQEDETTTD